MKDRETKTTEREALLFHSKGRPGKLEIVASKPMATQRDLSLAYSPGVAVPVKEIARDPDLAYDYTTKGNLVAVISNGSAILGLGNLGALASKPVMEGKAVLFKRFADVDAIDLEINTDDVDVFVNCVAPLEPSFGGINLEDIKAPECFIIEDRLKEMMDIPVFHDDQHGTAIITAAGFINALDLTGRDIKDCRVVVNGAGAAAIACSELIKGLGLPADQLIMCDSKGVIYKGRKEGMNQWKSAHAVDTDLRTLEEALKGADAFIGLSVKGAVSREMVASMADKPIIFAMANPDPEITPEEVYEVRQDAIVATGRSDYPNQVNNVLGFPYIFRGALDVRARTINEPMKIAAARAIAQLAREDVPDEVAAAYSGEHPKYGPDYIIPAPFDPRLISAVPPAVAKAAMDSGVARRPIIDMEAYHKELDARLNPTIATLQMVFDELRSNPQRVVFAEGEEETVIRAAIIYRNSGYGTPILIGNRDRIRETMNELGFGDEADIEIQQGRESPRRDDYVDYLYNRLQRRGSLHRDCLRLVNNDRNVLGACMVALGDADAMVTGMTRSYSTVLEAVNRVMDAEPGHRVFGLTIVVTRTRTVFIADTAVHERPTAQQLADIAEQSAAAARRFGHEPRVAFLSYSNFGNPMLETAAHLREAVQLLDQRNVDFEYEGEMTAAVALNMDMRPLYPFCRLTGPANVLIMPALHSAHISSKLLKELGGGKTIGPVLIGLEKSIQVVPMDATASDLVNMAAIAAHNAIKGIGR
ncbi:MAG: NADP-dependent malic enzyme [Alphaproteobacteria bacterium]|nr:MAG: NADP-dependent malic enzyme [Alphaproteobacteria bacterium]